MSDIVPLGPPKPFPVSPTETPTSADLTFERDLEFHKQELELRKQEFELQKHKQEFELYKIKQELDKLRREHIEGWVSWGFQKVGGLGCAIVGAIAIFDPSLLHVTIHDPDAVLGVGAALLMGNKVIDVLVRVAGR